MLIVYVVPTNSPGLSNGATAVLLGIFLNHVVLFGALICGAFFMSAFKSLATMAMDASMAAQCANFLCMLVVQVFVVWREACAPQIKSRITLRDTWSKRQAGAMRPIRRARWVWAASCAPAGKSCAG